MHSRPYGVPRQSARVERRPIECNQASIEGLQRHEIYGKIFSLLSLRFPITLRSAEWAVKLPTFPNSLSVTSQHVSNYPFDASLTSQGSKDVICKAVEACNNAGIRQGFPPILLLIPGLR
jgi:hypothetical protein